MSTTFDLFAESQEVSGKGSGSHLRHSTPVNEAHLAFTIVEHTTKHQDLVALQAWLRTAPTGLLKIQDISLQEAKALQVKLQELGHRVRLDWRHSDQTAVFRMPMPLHNAPAAWLTLCVPNVEHTVQGAARCGTPVLLIHGDGSITRTGGESQPDNQIDLNVHFEHKDEANTYCVPEPRVVLETAFSQPVKDAEKKAWEYLCAGDGHTHAVIVVDMSYPVTERKTFVAKIAVWGRLDTGNTDVDYPFEESEQYQHGLRPMPVDVDGLESSVPPNELSVAGSGSLMLVSEGTTQVNIGPAKSICKRTADGSMGTIETPGYIVVLDENIDSDLDAPSPQGFELVLDVFHFLRRCPLHPDDIPWPSEVVLPLAPLRCYLIEALLRHGEEQWGRKRKAEAQKEDTTKSTLPQNVDLATLRSTTPPMLREWKHRKKQRRVA